MTPALFGRSAMKAGAVLLLLLTSSAPIVSQKEKHIVIGSEFLTPEEFLALSKDARAIYSMGFVDGVFLAPYFEANNDAPLFIAFKACVHGKSGSQISAIIEERIKQSQPGEQFNML